MLCHAARAIARVMRRARADSDKGKDKKAVARLKVAQLLEDCEASLALLSCMR
jgi:hypothetical protein